MLARIRKAIEEKDEKGFTLIELLVVIIIIGILAAIAIPIFLNQRKKAVDASIKSDLKTVADAEETYSVDHASDAVPYTNAVANLPDLKLSAGNTVKVGVTADGYCITGYNSKGTASAAGTAFWYDSKLGGLQAGSPGAAPTGGICQAQAPDGVLQAGS